MKAHSSISKCSLPLDLPSTVNATDIASWICALASLKVPIDLYLCPQLQRLRIKSGDENGKGKEKGKQLVFIIYPKTDQ